MFDKNNTEQDIEIKSSSRIKPLIGVFLVLLSLAAYVFLISPVAGELSTVKAKIVEVEEQTSDLKEKIGQYEKAETQLDLSTEVQKLEILKAVPTEMAQDGVIRDLVNIADNYDTQLHSISFGKGSSGKAGVSVLRVNASLEGNYNDLTRFLQGIEQNARMLRVNSISVQVNTLDVSDIKRATFSLSMEAFFQDIN